MANKKLKINSEEDNWETIIDFTEISKDGVSGREILERLKSID